VHGGGVFHSFMGSELVVTSLHSRQPSTIPYIYNSSSKVVSWWLSLVSGSLLAQAESHRRIHGCLNQLSLLQGLLLFHRTLSSMRWFLLGNCVAVVSLVYCEKQLKGNSRHSSF
jgi:hypothetical protein